MADFTESEREVANRIVSRLLEGEESEMDLPPHMVVSDVELHAQEFSLELDLLEAIERDVPAMRVGQEELVPVSLSLLMGGAWPVLPLWSSKRRPWRMHPFYREWIHYELRPALEGRWGAFDLETLPRAEARETFTRRATEFLANRLSWVSSRGRNTSDRGTDPQLSLAQRVGGPRVTTPGCLFTVSSSSTGLRVFWSGAYFISPNYFGHPTTPTSSVLQAGVYVFGVDGGAYGSRIHWDHAAVVSLPGHPHVHLTY